MKMYAKIYYMHDNRQLSENKLPYKSLFIAFVVYFETADWLTRAAAIIHIIELILQIFQFQSVSRFDYLMPGS